MRILDRYLIREVLPPALIGLLVFTFILIVPYLIETAEEFIAKGVSGLEILQVMLTLVPSALGLTIPMSLLLGLLVAFGRLSSDREFVAMQACGVSLFRLLRPVALLSLAAAGLTLYVLLVSVPEANQSFREITFNIIAARAEGEVRPRALFDKFPDLMLYVREVPTSGGWRDVFVADTRPNHPQTVYLARRGRVVIDRERRAVDMVLEDGSQHVTEDGGKYEGGVFSRALVTVNPEQIFPRNGPQKGDNEMSVAELRARIADLSQKGLPTQGSAMALHQKFSIPFACLVFGLIGIGLGVSNRRDGRLASFVVGVAVIFGYYVLLWFGRSVGAARLVTPWLAVWAPNLILTPLALILVFRRNWAVERLTRFFSPNVSAAPTTTPRVRFRMAVPRLRNIRLPLKLLDRYVAVAYVRVFLVAFFALIGIFYISTFLDLSDEVFRGDSTWSELLAYFWFESPQYVYYVLPIAVLLATLVTVGLLMKNSELIVMRACGISLYRTVLPILVCGFIGGAALLGLQETILGPWHRRAEALRHVIRGGSPESFDVLSRRWVVGGDGDIYHYAAFDPSLRQLTGLSIYHFEPGMTRLARRTYAEHAAYDNRAGARGTGAWVAEKGWTRDFEPDGMTRHYGAFVASVLSIEPPAYFATQQPDPDYMSYSQLRSYTQTLQSGGVDVAEQKVALQRKMAFPFVTMIMTLIAVPFAVTTGRRGAMYGVGVGILLALIYWGVISVFAAFGTAGLMAPALAAWTPNLLFSAGAVYLLLTVRT